MIRYHPHYRRFRRIRDAAKHIRNMVHLGGPRAMERTQSLKVADTYGIEQAFVKRMKAKFRNEISFNSEGK